MQRKCAECEEEEKKPLRAEGISGMYPARSSEGRKLLARALTHVVQQGFRQQAIQQKKNDKPKEADKKATTIPKQVLPKSRAAIRNWQS